MYKKIRNQGFVLVSSLVFIVIITIISLALLQRITVARADVTASELDVKAALTAEKIINKAVDFISEKSLASPEINSVEIAKLLTDDWLIKYPETGISFKSPTQVNALTNNQDYKSYITSYNTTKDFLNSTEFSAFANKSAPNSYLNNCKYTNCFSSNYNITIDQSKNIKGVFEVFAIPVGTNIRDKTVSEMYTAPITAHIDLIKVNVNVYMPTKEKYKVKKSLEVIVRRPFGVTSGSAPVNINAGLMSDGSMLIDGGTQITSSPAPGQAHIHSNDKISIQPGVFDGNITAVNSISENWGQNIDNRSMALVNKIPIPELSAPIPITTSTKTPQQVFDSYDGGPYVVASNTTINGTMDVGWNYFTWEKFQSRPRPVILENVVINGDLNLTGSRDIKIIIKGNVKVTGNIVLGNAGVIEGGTNPNSLVADGTITSNGALINDTSATQNKTLFISNSSSKNAINITQGANTNGVFYASNPNGGIKVDGGAKIFGALISKGTLDIRQGPKVIRDTDLGSITGAYSPVTSSIDPSLMKSKVAIWNQSK